MGEGGGVVHPAACLLLFQPLRKVCISRGYVCMSGNICAWVGYVCMSEGFKRDMKCKEKGEERGVGEKLEMHGPLHAWS